MGWTGRAILILLLGVLGPFIAERYKLAYIAITNQPAFLATKNTFSKHRVLFKDEIRNCEDVVLDEANGIAFLTCDPGRDRWNTVMGTFIDPDFNRGWIYYYPYTDDPLKAKKIEGFTVEDLDYKKGIGFHPLGLAFHAESDRMFVVNHGKEGPTIEVLGVSKDRTTLTYQQTVEHPLLNAPNSVYPISATELYVTNDHRWTARDKPLLSKLETMLAYPGGSINYVDIEKNITQKLYDIPFANGIANINNTHLAVASTTLPGVYIFRKGANHTDLRLERRIRTNFHADNLHVDSNGKLLIAGHPNGFKLQHLARENHKYDLDQGSAMTDEILLPEKDRPRAPSWVAEWDGNEQGKLKDLYISNYYGTSTSAVRDARRNVVIVSGLYEKGLLVAHE